MSGDIMAHFMQTFFRPFARTAQESPWHPAADVHRTRDGWLLKFELAGVRAEDIRVLVSGSRLRVGGTRRDCSMEEGGHCHRMEIAYSQFERVIELPEDIENADIESEYRDGMLFVRIRQ